MASDGNRHVKVQLLCPQCRGDLTHTINDTVLLRKAKNAEKYRDVTDSELNATELRLKHEYITVYAADVGDAEARLRKFHRDKGNENQLPEPLERQIGTADAQVEKPFIDISLFRGLESSMSDDERLYVQALFTSGDTESLASAAMILNGILQLTIQGMTPKNTTERSWSEERKHIEQLELFRKRYPLPARMPKYFVLDSFAYKKRTLQFVDDQWDGSIADAFSRVHMAKPKRTPGMDNILSEAENTHLPPKARIKIASIKGQAGKLGLQKGDVVTHVNGEPFEGSADQLKHLIASFHDGDESSTFQIVVNADDSTAEVLKLRSHKCSKAMADIANL